eukprot:3353952-Rhodomonas_salina.2
MHREAGPCGPARVRAQRTLARHPSSTPPHLCHTLFKSSSCSRSPPSQSSFCWLCGLYSAPDSSARTSTCKAHPDRAVRCLLLAATQGGGEERGGEERGGEEE